MGLYLCTFDTEEKEIDGLEVGSYEYFGIFRECVNEIVEKSSEWGSICPKIMLHSDCDGKWTPNECAEIIIELEKIKLLFQNEQPNQKVIELKKNILTIYGINPSNLYDCFVDVDGENLIDGLATLCKNAIKSNLEILFQ